MQNKTCPNCKYQNLDYTCELSGEEMHSWETCDEWEEREE